MNLKRILAGAALALPIAVTFIPSQADAQIRPQFRRYAPVQIIKKRPQVRVYAPVQARRRVLVPGRWVQTNRGRQRIPAHYVYR